MLQVHLVSGIHGQYIRFVIAASRRQRNKPGKPKTGIEE